MSTLKLGTIATQDGTESTEVTNVVNGSAKAWVNFKGTGTVAIRRSFNVNSITDNGTGNYTVNFTTSMVDANYCSVFGNEGGFDVNRYQSDGTKGTGTYQVRSGYQTSSGSMAQADIGTIQVTIFS